MQAERSFRRGIALMAAATLFMENLDGTIIQTAVPAMAREFHVTPPSLNIAVAAYLFAVGVVIPASGWLTDRLGIRRVYLVAIVVFTVASAACAFAPSLWTLTLARVAQGVGGALMVPVGRLAVLRDVTPAHLLDAIAYLTWPALIAPVVAPGLGGLLTDTVGWRGIFLINLPLGVIALIAAAILLPRERPGPAARFDLGGFLGMAAALVVIAGGAEIAAGGDLAAIGVGLAAVALGGLVLWGTAARMRRVRRPLVDWTLLRLPSFRAGSIDGGLYRLMITAAPFLCTLQFQVAFGWSAARAGLMVMLIFVGNVAIKPATTPLLRRWGFRRVLIWSNACGCAVLAGFACVDARTPVVIVGALLLVSGVFRSIGFSGYNTLQYVDVHSGRMSRANALNATIQQLAAALGVSVAAVFVAAGTTLAGEIAHRPALGYGWAYLAAAAIMLVPLAGAIALPRDVGAAATGHSASS